MGVLYARVGGAWQPVGFSAADRWNAAWGQVAYAQVTTSQTGITNPGSDLTGLTVTFTPVVGRQYRTSASILFQQMTSGATCYPTITDASNTTLQDRRITNAASAYFSVDLAVVETFATTAPVTRKARAMAAGGTVNLNAAPGMASFITVEDIGPVSGAPAIANPTPGWINLTFLNGWNNIAGWAGGQYRRVGDIVSLRGLIQNSTAPPANATQTIASLPAGYQPLGGSEIFNCNSQGSAGYGETTIRVQVMSDGQIQVVRSSAATQNPSGYLSLGGIQFSVTP